MAEVTTLKPITGQESATTFPLLDLPPELWARVVKAAVVTPLDPWHCVDETPIDFGVPSIAKTCRTIRSEALKLYYKHNTFPIRASCDERDFTACHEWMESMVNRGCSSIMKPAFVKICCYVDASEVALAFEGYFPEKKFEVMRDEADEAKWYHISMCERTAEDGGLDESKMVSAVAVVERDDGVAQGGDGEGGASAGAFADKAEGVNA